MDSSSLQEKEPLRNPVRSVPSAAPAYSVRAGGVPEWWRRSWGRALRGWVGPMGNHVVRSSPVGLSRRAVAALASVALIGLGLGFVAGPVSPAAADNAIATITVGTAPFGVAVNPVTNRIYVANHDSNTVTVIDGVTQRRRHDHRRDPPASGRGQPGDRQDLRGQPRQQHRHRYRRDHQRDHHGPCRQPANGHRRQPGDEQDLRRPTHGSSVTVIDGATNT